MSGPLGSSQWMYNPSTSFYSKTIDQSLRFEEADTPSLSRTQTSGTTTTWTFSAWVKRSRLDSILQSGGVAGQDPIFSVGDANTDDMLIYFHQDSTADRLDIIIRDSSTIRARLITTRQFRDVAAFYHIQVTCDFTNATQGDRLRLYVNGVRETDFDTETYPSDTSQITVVNNSSYTARIGQLRTSASYFAGYMAEVHLVDGSALEPTSFGEFSNGVWIPVSYSGSHGTAGWYLPFDDDAALGDDESANTNDFLTVVGLAATDVVLDSPTNNFATLNSLDNAQGATISEGGLRASNASGTDKRYHSTFGMATGKWYWEVRVNTAGTRNQIGVFSDENTASTSLPTNYAHIGVGNSSGATSGTFNGTKFTASNGDIVTFAFDADNGNLYYGQNSAPTIGATADISGLASDTYLFGCRETSTSPGNNTLNFGQDSTFAGTETAGGNADGNGYGNFAYAPPSGFLALCSANLPEPTIGPNSTTSSEDNFDTILYTGNGTSNGDSQEINGLSFQPDLTWIKARNAAHWNELHDSVRGAGKRLFSNEGNLESDYATVSSFDSDGFTVAVGTSGQLGTNQNGTTYVGWNWKAGGAASSIAVDEYSTGVPSIASSVSANTDAGFSIVSYTGVTGTGTVGHGLSSAPEMVIVKRRGTTTSNWFVYHAGTVATAEVLYLNLENAAAVSSAIWNSTAPTANVFSLGTGNTNTNGDTYIAYCFHSVEGYSRCGVYNGNAGAFPNGTFIYTGFRPALVAVKGESITSNWIVTDNERASNYNGDTARLYWTTGAAETAYSSARNVELFSNGFMVHGSSASDVSNKINQSGRYVYLAFAEAPFKYANAR